MSKWFLSFISLWWSFKSARHSIAKTGLRCSNSQHGILKLYTRWFAYANRTSLSRRSCKWNFWRRRRMNNGDTVTSLVWASERVISVKSCQLVTIPAAHRPIMETDVIVILTRITQQLQQPRHEASQRLRSSIVLKFLLHTSISRC